MEWISIMKSLADTISRYVILNSAAAWVSNNINAHAFITLDQARHLILY